MTSESLQNEIHKAWLEYHSVVHPSKEENKIKFQKNFKKVIEKEYKKAIK